MASSFGAALTVTLSDFEMSDADLGRAIGTTGWTVTKWKNGKTPCLEGFNRIVAFFPDVVFPRPRGINNRGNHNLGPDPTKGEDFTPLQLPEPKAKSHLSNIICMIELCLEFKPEPRSAIEFIHALCSKALGK